MALGLKVSGDSIMPDVSTDDDASVDNHDHSLFSQAMLDKDLSPAKQTHKASLADRKREHQVVAMKLLQEEFLTITI